MKLLITGAWSATAEQLDEVRRLGHEVIMMQQEKEALPRRYDEAEGCVCNGLFLYHPVEKFTSLRYIQLTSAGYDRAPMEYAGKHGIVIHNAHGVYSIPMAEHALAMTLATFRKLSRFDEARKQRRWEKQRDLPELYGKTVLILGCGSVGTECAKRFRAFGCGVIGIDLTTERKNPAFQKIELVDRLEQWLPGTNILVAALPKTTETTGMIGAEQLKLLPDGALICNIARGGIIERESMTAELSRGRLSACLDVFDEEPLPPESPLWDLSNVMITPHNSFAGQGNGRRLARAIINNLQRMIRDSTNQQLTGDKNGVLPSR